MSIRKFLDEISRRPGGSGSSLVACDFEDGECTDDFVNRPSVSDQKWIRTDVSLLHLELTNIFIFN